MADGGGDTIWGGVGVEPGPEVKRSVIAWLDALCGACDCGTGIPDIPRTRSWLEGENAKADYPVLTRAVRATQGYAA
jgi:hypothetical protein